MPNIPRIVSAPVEYIPVLSSRFASRIAICVLLTALDAWVIVAYGPTLYEFSSGHLSWLAALAALLATMLVSLIRVWSVTLHRRFQ